MLRRDNLIILYYGFSSKTTDEVKEVSKFRINLLKLGFKLMQESVYYKHIKNVSMKKYEIAKIKKISPSFGNITISFLPSSIFNNMIFISGKSIDLEEINSDIIVI